MSRSLIVLLTVAISVVVAGLSVGVYTLWWHANYYEIERTDYNPPNPDTELKFVDDRLEDKNPAFDETLIDSRPLGEWEVNASAAVVKLDCPMLKPDRDAELLTLRASYAAAVAAAKKRGLTMLPSANLIDGAAKQFDDGLYAALDLAAFRGELGFGQAAPEFVRAVFDALPSDSPARPFLAAATELAGKPVEVTADERAQVKSLLATFERNKAISKPISFYNWTPELKQVWRFYRFLQREFPAAEIEIPRSIAAVLEKQPELRTPYASINGFYSQLTNPLTCLSVDLLAGSDKTLDALANKHGRRPAVAVFPPSTSRETELFNRVFGLGLPPRTNLMARLIQAVRSGEVDLKPRENDGWYQYQVYALETMLLPSQGQEGQKLLLTAAYKKRLVEAFKAMITKRRETHARQLASAGDSAAAPPPDEVKPRLRLEPCATYYLRTARAYAFLQNFLRATVDKDRFARLHGLKKGGQREIALADELDAMRLRSYGFYLVACEDIGMRPKLLTHEPVDQAAAKQAALDWFAKLAGHADLACDTRVSVPIFISQMTNKTRLWATLGVRLARLDASYARGPKIRPKAGGDWQDVGSHLLDDSRYVIAVDEFAEIELTGSASLTRQELRAACDRHKTKEAIIRALSN